MRGCYDRVAIGKESQDERKDEQALPADEGTAEEAADGPPLGGAPGGEEEARMSKPIPQPELPCRDEVNRHRVDHIPYRSWCPECVEGFARERAHRPHVEEHRTVPIVACDYMYLTRSGVYSRSEVPGEEKEGSLRILVAKCSSTQCLFAHAVPQKGIDEDGFVIDEFKNDIAWLGHSRVMIRSDNEPALLKVVDKVVKALKSCLLYTSPSPRDRG